MSDVFLGAGKDGDIEWQTVMGMWMLHVLIFSVFLLTDLNFLS